MMTDDETVRLYLKILDKNENPTDEELAVGKKEVSDALDVMGNMAVPVIFSLGVGREPCRAHMAGLAILLFSLQDELKDRTANVDAFQVLKAVEGIAADARREVDRMMKEADDLEAAAIAATRKGMS